MAKGFTPEDLIAYLYHETSASTTLAIDEALHDNPLLAAEFAELHEAKRQLPRVKFNAPRRAMQRILEYSRVSAFEQQA